jgi:hypothetical protein
MIQKIELITKKLTKLINQKAQKEAELIKIQNDIDKMSIEIVEAENNVIELLKAHQKEMKTKTKKITKKIEQNKTVEVEQE